MAVRLLLWNCDASEQRDCIATFLYTKFFFSYIDVVVEMRRFQLKVIPSLKQINCFLTVQPHVGLSLIHIKLSQVNRELTVVVLWNQFIISAIVYFVKSKYIISARILHLTINS